MAIKDDDIQDNYVISLSGSLVQETDGTLPDNKGFVPFRLYAFGPFNIRKQSATAAYRTFIGEQET